MTPPLYRLPPKKFPGGSAWNNKLLLRIGKVEGSPMKAATHNVLHTLGHRDTSSSVRRVLSLKPQIVAFQEFDSEDNLVLRSVALEVAYLDQLKTKKPYLWCRSAAGGLPVLLRTSYVHSIQDINQIMMSKGSKSIRPTPATEVVFKNRFETDIAVINTHPMAHVDDPEHKDAHDEAKSNIEAWASKQVSKGRIPIVLMDGNGIKKLEGLISCWEGQPLLPTGPHGGTIDGGWTTRPSDHVDTLGTPSDHDAVVVTYKNFG